MSEQKVNSGILRLLEFKSIKKSSSNEPKKEHDVFKVMINPDSISHTVSLSTTNNPSGGSSDKGDAYSCNTEDISFAFYLDGTNVVPPTPGRKEQSVDEMVEAFLNTVYKKTALNDNNNSNSNSNSNDDESTKPVQAVYIEYGDLKWTVRTKTITIERTLFDSLGKTLRAKVTCSFETIEDDTPDQTKNNKSAPSKRHKKDNNSCDCAQMCAVARSNNQDSLYYTPADANFMTADGYAIKV